MMDFSLATGSPMEIRLSGLYSRAVVKGQIKHGYLAWF